MFMSFVILCQVWSTGSHGFGFGGFTCYDCIFKPQRFSGSVQTCGLNILWPCTMLLLDDNELIMKCAMF